MNKIIIGIIILGLGGWFLFAYTEKSNIKSVEKEKGKGLRQEESKNIAYIALGGANKVALVDIDKKELIKTFDASNNPHGVAVAGGYIFTSSTKMGAKEMAMASEGNSEKMEAMPKDEIMSGMEGDAKMSTSANFEANGGENPHHPQKSGMKVGGDTIAVISQETGKIIKEINLGGGSHHMSASSDGAKLAVTVPSQNGVAIIDVKKLEKTAFFETGKVSNYAVFSKNGNFLFVSNSAGNTLSIIDFKKANVKNLVIGTLPDHIALGKKGKFIYVANGGDDAVAVVNIESGKIERKISVGKTPHGIAVSGDGKKLFTANSQSNTVSVIDIKSNQVMGEIEFENKVAHMEIAPNTKELWVNSEEGRKVYIVDIKNLKIINEIELSLEPHQIVF